MAAPLREAVNAVKSAADLGGPVLGYAAHPPDELDRAVRTLRGCL